MCTWNVDLRKISDVFKISNGQLYSLQIMGILELFTTSNQEIHQDWIAEDCCVLNRGS